MTKKILVTGGLGYIGSHTVVSLAEAGFTPIIVDNLQNSKKETLLRIARLIGFEPEFHKFNLTSTKQTETLFKQHKFDGVVHFAAYKAVGESIQKPLDYYRNNIYSMVNVLEAAYKTEVNAFIFSSSASVYGFTDALPISENAPIKQAASPYGNTKKVCEEILRDAALVNPNMQAVSLRYFNPIGAHPSVLIGEIPNGEPQNLVPFITQTAAGLHPEIEVFGDDYPTPDGSCVRDYIYIMDLAEAHVAALKKALANKNKQETYHFYNVGTGKGTSVLELIKLFEEVNNIRLPYKIVGRRLGDVPALYANTDLAFKELHWKAKTPLCEALKTVWAWEKAFQGSNFDDRDGKG